MPVETTRFFAGASATITVRVTFQPSEMFSDAGDTLFERFVNNSMHVLHPILPQKSVQPYNLRKRHHSYYSLFEKTSELNERDYITRILYKNCY